MNSTPPLAALSPHLWVGVVVGLFRSVCTALGGFVAVAVLSLLDLVQLPSSANVLADALSYQGHPWVDACLWADVELSSKVHAEQPPRFLA